MAKIGRSYNKVQSNVGYSVDITEITAALKEMDNIPAQLPELAQEIANAARFILEEEFEYAMEAQSDIALPQEFRQHIREVVSESHFDIRTTGTTIDIEFDFNQLGTVQDLKRAFHQGARTADGDIIDGPYEGEELENPVGERHLYWEAMVKGLDKAPTSKTKGGSIRIKEGAWDETKQKYIQIWGDKAPQWLYLQFGQQKWEPTIRPSSIIEGFSARFNEEATRIFETALVEEVEIAQTPFGTRLIGPTKELGPSGRPRQVGQFYPKRR